MNRLTAILLPVFPAVAAMLQCHPPPEEGLLVPKDSSACYALHAGPWTSSPPQPLAAAPAGLQMPLPDTIGLSHAVARISYGRPFYVVLTLPADSDHAGGWWLPRAHD